MNPTICSKCKKNVAVVFITKMENGKTINEGLCLKCAKEMGIKPVDDIIQKMGLSEDELDGITNEMMNAFGGAEGLEQIEDEDDFEEGKTATFPFLNKLFGAADDGATPSQPRQNQGQNREKSERGEKKKKFLDNYCICLTDRARQGKLDNIVGRDEETNRVVQILNRRQKNNPCLIGEPGVGKTAIAEGLAIKIAQGNVPYKLKDKEVYLLDLTSLVAGTQFRGQFESRMKGLIEEIKKFGNIILVIDEVHNLVGAGDAEGSMNAANILKPALSRGEIQVIGATTFTEYRKHIEKDSALERRFQPVTVNEPSIEESVKIIEGIAHYYESFHGVKITEKVARQAVILSERYITDRFLPDKAIDLIDEACSDVNLRSKVLENLAEARKELDDISLERDHILADAANADYERLAHLKSCEMQTKDKIAQLEAEGVPELTVENLANVIELWTKIPASKINTSEYGKLKGLEDRLKQRVVGQDEAVKTVSAAIRRSRVGISAKRRPVSFIFVGSTGVGKTELVKCLAEDLFDSVDSLIRLDMSEYMEKHSVSKIIGSPPGYVGYDEAGQLTEKIRRKPYAVILFDEIEKAHADVLNILLQILDDGRITDAHGRTVNFENTVIIMTSNAGSDKKDGTVGFNRTINEQTKEKAVKALNDFLRPEFINRVDEIVAFNRLTEDDFAKITVIMLKELAETIKDKDIALTWDDKAVMWLTHKSFSETYGARNLRRLIQKEVEDKMASILIDSYENGVSQMKLTVKDDMLDVEAL